ncbi:hypothetical protein [Halostagnicola bangensis]
MRFHDVDRTMFSNRISREMDLLETDDDDDVDLARSIPLFPCHEYGTQ